MLKIKERGLKSIKPKRKMKQPDPRERAIKTIFKTLDYPSEKDIKKFPSILEKSIRDLPRYKKISQRIGKTRRIDIAYKLFQLIRKESDLQFQDITNKDVPDDGVFITSMKEGKFECAGRAMLVALLLKDHKIKSSLVIAPHHSFNIVHIDSATLAYLDGNRSLYFTFPAESLEGYKGPDSTSECFLKEYIPRRKDFFDGFGAAYLHFITAPVKEISRRYLDNVKAALSGFKEFKKSGVKADPEAKNAISVIMTEVLGESSKVRENYRLKIPQFTKIIEKEDRKHKQEVLRLLSKYPKKIYFVREVSSRINNNLGMRMPYLKNAPKTDKEKYTAFIWDYWQNNKCLYEFF